MPSTTVAHGKKPADASQRVELLRSDEELDEATRELCALMSSGGVLSGADEERLQRLVDAVEAYEDIHYRIQEPSHAALLKHLLAAKGDGLAKLAKAVKIPMRDIKAILGGKRQVWPSEAEAFSKYFSVDRSVFEPEPDTVAVVGVVVGSGLAGVQKSSLFRIAGRPSATSTGSTNGLPSAVASIMRQTLQWAGSGPPPLVGLKS